MKHILLCLSVGALMNGVVRAEETHARLDDVVGILRTNLPGITESQLEDAGIRGLVRELKPKVLLESSNSAAKSNAALPEVASRAYGDFGCIRVRQVGPGLVDRVAEAVKNLNGATNKLKGLVLDLRFAQGDDYSAAAAVAGLFIADARPILALPSGVLNSSANSSPIALPLAIIVNGETAGAAEALGAVLREAQCGLLVGNRTSGEALVYREFPLADGRHLKVAGASVELPGKGPLPTRGLVPDISVAVSLADERLFYADPYRAPKLAQTNADKDDAIADDDELAGSHRLNEAELVRLQKQGISPEEAFAPRPAVTRLSEAELVRQKKGMSAAPAAKVEPLLTDPALGRSIDLLKAIAVVRGKSG